MQPLSRFLRPANSFGTLLCSSRARKFVAESRDGHNQFRLTRIVLEFLAQAGHMHIDGACQCAGIISPNRAQEFFPRNAAPRSLDQIAEKVKLLSGESNGLIILGHFSKAKIQPVNTIASNDTLASSGVLTQSIGTPEASAPAGACKGTARPRARSRLA